MKQTILPGDTPETWDAGALYSKALRYIENTLKYESDAWEYALWSSLSLEFLARSALANVSPALLADGKDSWASLYHAIGYEPKESKFTPKSISISEVFKRLTSILPEYTKELADIGILLTGRRNSELHSGHAAFEGVTASSWQPGFYQNCSVLLSSMGLALSDFVGEDEADVATKIVEAANDESAKAVKGDLVAHEKVWSTKAEEERGSLMQSAAVWAIRQEGHRVECPACSSQALVQGEPVTAPSVKLDDDLIVETQEYLPNRFECIACGLKIGGLSRLVIAGIGDRYKKTQSYDPADFYETEDPYQGYEEDNNER